MRRALWLLVLGGCTELLGVEDVHRAPDARPADAAELDAPAPDAADAPALDARAVDARVAIDASKLPDATAVVDAAPCVCTGFYQVYCDFSGCECMCDSFTTCGTETHACE